jgi:hypothetical protein
MMKEQGEIIWEDPPEPQLRAQVSGWWAERLAQIMARPNEWAKVWVGPKNTGRVYAARINRGYADAHDSKSIKIPDGRWEAVSRIQPSGKDVAVYVKYLGPEEGKGKKNS